LQTVAFKKNLTRERYGRGQAIRNQFMHRRLAQTASAARRELWKVSLCLAWPAHFLVLSWQGCAGSDLGMQLVQRAVVGPSPGSPSTLEGSKKKLPSCLTVIDLNPLTSGAHPVIASIFMVKW